MSRGDYGRKRPRRAQGVVKYQRRRQERSNRRLVRNRLVRPDEDTDCPPPAPLDWWAID